MPCEERRFAAPVEIAFRRFSAYEMHTTARIAAGKVSTRGPSTFTLFREPPSANFCMSYPRRTQRIGDTWTTAHRPIVIGLAACYNDPPATSCRRFGLGSLGDHAHRAPGSLSRHTGGRHRRPPVCACASLQPARPVDLLTTASLSSADCSDQRLPGMAICSDGSDSAAATRSLYVCSSAFRLLRTPCALRPPISSMLLPT